MSTLIIAEAGVNHNGRMDLARELIRAAGKAGADYVKFQSFRADELASPQADQAEYQTLNTGKSESQLQMLKRLELSRENHFELIDCCRTNGIRFLSSPFSTEDLDMLIELGVDLLKLPSGEITNYPLLKRAGETGLPILLSTGMASLGEVEDAVGLLLSSGLRREKLTLLQCTTEYPAPYEDVNLRAMKTLSDAFGVNYGFSDHTRGISIAVAAVALGASVVEKHFTVSRDLPGPDHSASLVPTELEELVRSVRQVELSLGSTRKEIAPSEFKNRMVARKSLHLRIDLTADTVLQDEHLQALRPGTGLSPMVWPEIVGRRLSRALRSGHMLRYSDLVPVTGKDGIALSEEGQADATRKVD